MDTQYTSKFQKLREVKNDVYVLRGNNVLVEIIEEELKTKSGLVLTTVSSQIHGLKETAGLVGVVLDTGEGYYDEESKETVPLDVMPGDIVLVPKYAVSFYSTFPGIQGSTNNKIALCLENEIKMYYRGQDAYVKAQALLND